MKIQSENEWECQCGYTWYMFPSILCYFQYNGSSFSPSLAFTLFAGMDVVVTTQSKWIRHCRVTEATYEWLAIAPGWVLPGWFLFMTTVNRRTTLCVCSSQCTIDGALDIGIMAYTRRSFFGTPFIDPHCVRLCVRLWIHIDFHLSRIRHT